MKKTLSLIVVLCMLASMIVLPAFAAESTVGSVAADYKPAEGATAVSNEAEFLAMAADGNYYLAADITLSAPYTAAFTGTIDGCGKKVTVSYPIFVDFGGTAKNIVIEGSITSLAADSELAALADNGARGALASRVNSGTEVVFENIQNNANVSAIGKLTSDNCAGGIVGKVECESAAVKFINCENNGSITGLNQIGGIAGYVKNAASLTVENCVNNGDITNTESNAYSAGIICRINVAFVMKGCTNNGLVISGKDQAGGMVSYAVLSATFEDCVNTGKIAPLAGHAGGIYGNINANSKVKNGEITTTNTVTVKNCSNFGEVIATDEKYAGGISGRTQNALPVTYENCINAGKISSPSNAGGIAGHNNATVTIMKSCINTGAVESTGGYAGGIIGYAQGSAVTSYSFAQGGYSINITECANTANIVGAARTGGVVGSIGGSSRFGLGYVSSCINTGNVTCTGDESASQVSASGIVGYAYGSAVQTTHITNCVTTGNITATGANFGKASYFLGYINSADAAIKDNIGFGTLTAPELAVEQNESFELVKGTGAFAFGWNNKSSFKDENLTGNVIASGYALLHNGVETLGEDGTTTIGWTHDTTKTVEVTSLASSEDAVAAINAKLSGTDYEAKVENGAIVIGEKSEVPEDTTVEDTTVEDTTVPETTEPGSSKPTGDSAVIFAAIALIALAGVAVVAKKRED